MDAVVCSAVVFALHIGCLPMYTGNITSSAQVKLTSCSSDQDGLGCQAQGGTLKAHDVSVKSIKYGGFVVLGCDDDGSRAKSSAELSECTADKCGYDGVLVQGKGASATISKCSVKGSGHFGVSVSVGASAVLSEVSVSDSRLAGLATCGIGSHLKAVGCESHRNKKSGLCVENQATLVADTCNCSSNRFGYRAKQKGKMELKNCASKHDGPSSADSRSTMTATGMSVEDGSVSVTSTGSKLVMAVCTLFRAPVSGLLTDCTLVQSELCSVTAQGKKTKLEMQKCIFKDSQAGDLLAQEEAAVTVQDCESKGNGTGPSFKVLSKAKMTVSNGCSEGKCTKVVNGGELKMQNVTCDGVNVWHIR